MEYDTNQIRFLAREIGSVAEAVSDVNRSTLRPVHQEISDSFRGKAATAFTEAFTDLTGNIDRTGNRLLELQSLLERLAQRLEEADREIQAAIEVK